jgi:hypothetical protein
VQASPLDQAELLDQGFTAISLSGDAELEGLQSVVASHFDGPFERWHLDDVDAATHAARVAAITEEVAATGLLAALVRREVDAFIGLLGPDLDIQAAPHVRVSRPDRDSDLVDWHRDTFYGGSPFDVKLWFPVFPLAPGAGFRLLPRSHLQPSADVRDVVDPDEYRAAVTKGSVDHRIGFPYAPKTDDTVATLEEDATVLLAPPVGAGIVFLSSMVHRAQNRSDRTRVSVDLAVRSAHIRGNTRDEYWSSLHRGVLSRAAERFAGPRS